jgi:hypothetical protein
MVDDDTLPWSAPPCPLCGSELDIEPVGTGAGIRIGYACEVHGIVIVTNPLDDTVFRPATTAAPTSTEASLHAPPDGERALFGGSPPPSSAFMSWRATHSR